MADKQTIEEIIGQMAGSVSMCWEPRPTGVFDSESARKYVEEASTKINQLLIKERLSEHDWYEKNETYQINGQPVMRPPKIRVVGMDKVANRKAYLENQLGEKSNLDNIRDWVGRGMVASNPEAWFRSLQMINEELATLNNEPNKGEDVDE